MDCMVAQGVQGWCACMWGASATKDKRDTAQAAVCGLGQTNNAIGQTNNDIGQTNKAIGHAPYCHAHPYAAHKWQGTTTGEENTCAWRKCRCMCSVRQTHMLN
eukprot:scpid49026/ scgid12599/ 